jgi:hypothetical protein
MLIMSLEGTWEELCYSYELPWLEDSLGRSLKDKSRISEGIYELVARSDGHRGWRLELQHTGHRENVQIHRAHKSMAIEGCILPVDFIDFENRAESGIGPVEQVRKGDPKIQTRSIALMDKIQHRYEALRKAGDGNATITLGAILPAHHRQGGSRIG